MATGQPITVRVLTREGLALEDQALAVRAPGGLGSLGVLRHHAPLVTTIVPGKFSWRRPDGATRMLLIGAGLLEVAHNRLTLFTDTITEPQQVNAAAPS